MNSEQRSVLKAKLLSIAAQLEIDSKYTKENAAKELDEIVYEMEKLEPFK